MTFAEFEQLPDPAGAARYELRHGELIVVPPPASVHFATQRRVRRLTRWAEAISTTPYFQGAPELVIELLSPSNIPAEMLEKEQVCLATGAREFWVVDMDRRQVKFSTPDGNTVTYKSAQSIPLLFAEGASLNVDQIFG